MRSSRGWHNAKKTHYSANIFRFHDAMRIVMMAGSVPLGHWACTIRGWTWSMDWHMEMRRPTRKPLAGAMIAQ